MGFAVMGQDFAGGGDCDGGVVGYDFPGGRWILSLGAGNRRRGAELWVADSDDAIEAESCTLGPECRWTCSRRFEVGGYSGEGGVVVAFSSG